MNAESYRGDHKLWPPLSPAHKSVPLSKTKWSCLMYMSVCVCVWEANCPKALGLKALHKYSYDVSPTWSNDESKFDQVWEKLAQLTKNRNRSVVCLEAQRVRSHHPPVLHHGGRDGLQVLEELSGLTGSQGLGATHDPLIGLRDKGKR